MSTNAQPSTGEQDPWRLLGACFNACRAVPRGLRIIITIIRYVVIIVIYLSILTFFLPRHLQNMSRTNTPYAPLENCPRGVQPNIYVNGFCSCFHHGEEYCNPCTYDFRYLNNMTIQDDLDEIIGKRLTDVRGILVVFCYCFADVIL